MKKVSQELIDTINKNSCFDLQFRRDVRRERLRSPTYYRWKAQFIITGTKSDLPKLSAIQKLLSCGKISTSKNQVRLSVQNINDLVEKAIYFLQKNLLSADRKKDFTLWTKAVAILYENKGKTLSSFEKQDLKSLLIIHRASLPYKTKPRNLKWMEMAETFSR